MKHRHGGTETPFIYVSEVPHRSRAVALWSWSEGERCIMYSCVDYICVGWVTGRDYYKRDYRCSALISLTSRQTFFGNGKSDVMLQISKTRSAMLCGLHVRRCIHERVAIQSFRTLSHSRPNRIQQYKFSTDRALPYAPRIRAHKLDTSHRVANATPLGADLASSGSG